MFRRRAKVPVAFLNEKAAANERLKNVTNRGKIEESLYTTVEEQPKVPTIKRRFWNPGEPLATPQ